MPATKTKPAFAFQLIRGRAHVDGHTYLHNEQGNNVIQTDIDLAKRFGADKFRKMDSAEGLTSPVPATSSQEETDVLDEMNVKELKEFADNSEIDIGDAKGKKDIISAIRAEMEAA